MKNLHYGWVMVMLTACVLAMHAFIAYTFGVFLKPIALEFGWERGALSSAYLILMVVMGILNIPAGRLTDKYGPRPVATAGGILVSAGYLLLSQSSALWQMYLYWGLLIGMGGACTYLPLISNIPRWFDRKRGLALSIVLTGFGVGAVISPPLVQWFISALGWQQALLILALMTFVIQVPLAQFMRCNPQSIGLNPYGADAPLVKQAVAPAPAESSLTQAIKTRRFWLLGLILLFWMFCLQVIMVHIVPYATDIGIPETAAASIMSILAAVTIAGRLTAGPISDRIGSRLALTGILVLSLLSLIWMLFARGIWGLYGFAAIFGFTYGSIMILQNVATAEFFGRRSLGGILAGVLLMGMVGGATGPLVAGYVFDATGGYTPAFLLSVVLCSISVVLSLILLRGREA